MRNGLGRELLRVLLGRALLGELLRKLLGCVLLGRKLLGRRLRGGYGVSRSRRALASRSSLRREIGRQRRPPLILQVRLHLVGMRLRRRVRELRVLLGEGVGHVGSVLRVVDCRLRHESISVHSGGLRGCLLLRHHPRAHPPDVIPRGGSGAHLRLWCMAARIRMSRMLSEHAVLDWR